MQIGAYVDKIINFGTPVLANALKSRGRKSPEDELKAFQGLRDKLPSRSELESQSAVAVYMPQQSQQSVTAAPAPAPATVISATELQGDSSASTATDIPQPTNEQYKRYQRGELCKVLLAVKGHLVNKCRIAGVPCDCVYPKHTAELVTLAQETIPMDLENEALYREIVAYASELIQKCKKEDVAERRYDDEYPGLAEKARNVFKQLDKLGADIVYPDDYEVIT